HSRSRKGERARTCAATATGSTRATTVAVWRVRGMVGGGYRDYLHLRACEAIGAGAAREAPTSDAGASPQRQSAARSMMVFVRRIPAPPAVAGDQPPQQR